MNNDNEYVASWLQPKIKQTDEQRYLAALYAVGEALL